MVKITGRHKEDLTEEQLKHLYEGVGWVSYTCDMDKLKRAIAGSLYVVTAWYHDELVGLLRVVGDGETILYIQDLVVIKEHRRHKIATGMVEKVIKKFPHVRQKVLVTEDTEEIRGFYEEVGFVACDGGCMVAYVRFD